MGRYLPLPFVEVGTYLSDQDSILSFGAMMTGGSLSQIGLFSLGLGPWMYALILMRLFSLGKGRHQMAEKTQRHRQHVLMSVIALIQGLSIAVNAVDRQADFFWAKVLLTTLVLVAGAYVLYWLGNQNTARGLGGASLIVLGNMLLGQQSALGTAFSLVADGHLAFTLFVLVWTLLAFFVAVTFEKAEYRLPLKRISINNELAEQAYMPIKIGISGGMPLMYAYTFLMFPQYVIMLASYLFPEGANWAYWSDFFTTASLPGTLIYGGIILILCLVFAQVSIDPGLQAENLRRSGDFIDQVRPGLATKRHISRLVNQLASFYGLFLVVAVLVPLLLALGNQSYLKLASLTGLFLMMAGMVLIILTEIAVARLAKGYGSLFEREG